MILSSLLRKFKKKLIFGSKLGLIRSKMDLPKSMLGLNLGLNIEIWAFPLVSSYSTPFKQNLKQNRFLGPNWV